MSIGIHGPVPDSAGSPVKPGADSRAAMKGQPWARRGLTVRSLAHLAAWTPFIYALARTLHDGWRPVSDTAVIALRSWDALSRNGLLVGEATRLAHGVYDLGPLQFWLLAVPVHADPAHGVLWGAAVWCMAAGSLAIEAAWAAAGELGAVLTCGTILGIVAWLPKIAMVPDWNPWFGMMFFLAALATGGAVLCGHQKWWPVLVITGSVAAQAHLMYAVAAACLLLVGLVAVTIDSLKSGTYRWLTLGIIAGLACWTAPGIQQFTARPGNMTQLIHTMLAGNTAKAGPAFGLKALSAATQPPAYWWRDRLPALNLATIEQREAWFGGLQLGLTAVALLVAILVLRSRRAAALPVLSLLASGAALETYSGVPASNLTGASTDLSYLMAPMFPVGVLAWLAVGSVLALAAWRALRWLRARSTAGQPGAARIFALAQLPRIAGLAAVALMAVLTARAAMHTGGPLPRQHTDRKDVAAAAATIERATTPQRIAIVVVTPTIAHRRQVTMGLAYALRTAGYAPEIPSWAFQLGPAYDDVNPVAHAFIFIDRNGRDAGMLITRAHRKRPRPDRLSRAGTAGGSNLSDPGIPSNCGYPGNMPDSPRTLTAALHREEDWYIAQCLEVDVASQGHTIDEALTNLAEAVELYLEEVDDPAGHVTETPLVTSFRLPAA